MIKNNFKLIALLVVLFGYATIPTVTHAETRVYSDNVKTNWTWDMAGSPYVLEEPIYIPTGSSLYIKEGVEIKSAVVEGGDPNTLTVEGSLTIMGTESNPVKLTNLYSIYFSNNTSNITNAIFDGTGIEMINASSTISNTTIKNAITGISAEKSKIAISGSDITNNSYGITSRLHMKFFQVNSYLPNTGGMGNLFEDLFENNLDSEQNIINIHNSVIVDNKYNGILNQTANTINARDNWWGRKEGPHLLDTFGAVDADPWLTEDPRIKSEEICCSSVVFFPGFEASRLYKDETGLLGTSTNTLWEPNRNDDVRKMYMDSQGVSLDKTIYTKDVISTVPPGIKIYYSFIQKMNELVKDGYINSWEPIPYDWRLGVYDLIDDKMLEKITNIASSSKTKKVTVVTHSNGGLVAKALMKKLSEMNSSHIVDKVINIAVPELGTPTSVSSMLHGENQSILGGSILSKDNARTFSKNLPGAYGLLPSRKFFEKNPINVITDLYSGNVKINNYDSFKNFLLSNTFSVASSTDTSIPLLLNSYLVSLSEAFHSYVDSWKLASTTDTLSIFGWGKPTVIALKYVPKKNCLATVKKLNNGKCPPKSGEILTTSGDSSVITGANSTNADSTLYFDMKSANRDRLVDVSHSNILESPDILEKLKDELIKPKTISATPIPKASYEKYFSNTLPIDTDIYLTVNIFSPVDIDVYDGKGGHIGPAKNPIEWSDVKYYENTIRGSRYSEIGETKMLTVLYNGDVDYQFVLSGNDVGTFSVETRLDLADVTIASTSFSEMPVTPLMNIDFSIPRKADTFAIDSKMFIDIDGDGTTDITSYSDTFINSTSTLGINDVPGFIEYIKKTILTLKLPTKEEKAWLNRIDKISKQTKLNPSTMKNIVKKLSDDKFKKRSLTEEHKSAILVLFSDLLEFIEQEQGKIKKID